MADNALLNDEDRARIRAAVRAAEARTSGEFVTVIAHQSSNYSSVPILWAALIALCVPALVLLIAPNTAFTLIYGAQVASFFALALVFNVPSVRLLLAPAALKREKSQHLARSQFTQQGLHRTRNGTGVLLFVSVAERYVEILADEGINSRVAPDTWNKIVQQFVEKVREGHAADGFVDAIRQCSDVLAEHFPVTNDDVNELSDRMVEL